MAIDIWGNWDGQPDYGTPNLQGSQNTTVKQPVFQGSSPTIQAPNTGTGDQRALLPSSGGATSYSAPQQQAQQQQQYTAPSYGGYASAAEQQAAQLKAERLAKANAMKSGLTNIVKSITGVYDALYGDIGVAAADKNKQVLGVYNQDVGALTDQFAGEFPAIGNAYSARNVYDSSYRIDKENLAKTGFQNTLNTRGQARDQDLAQVGQFVATQRADINAQKGLQNTLLKQISESDNPDELTQIQNQLTAKLAELRASRSGLKSQASYLDTLNKTVPAGSRLAGLRTSLTNVVKSQVPTALKRSIAENLINNAGLSPEEARAALGEFNLVLDDEENLQTA
jgi:hypothetical protein